MNERNGSVVDLKRIIDALEGAGCEVREIKRHENGGRFRRHFLAGLIEHDDDSIAEEELRRVELKCDGQGNTMFFRYMRTSPPLWACCLPEA